ncbi:polysaccharide pyruvyl transferase family protein [Brevibacillus sp. DP1.3A]|uniref:polysaccharide pyruvyl transferase family protein n=1 Tax=Brevibacillus sp. DP1.3A TaxID=2738867 RepID=UPI00156B70E8|nr:polysaccharide pyruvyl transferase family protein [Brevibacillus sp. DP1.3A]UED76415.1 polysaccharide pyruvyl transferase family protein [Brevibacillus sp. DP1.3A]
MNSSNDRILMVLDNLGTGGTETHVLSIGKALQKKGAQLFYAGGNGPLYQEFVDAGFLVERIESARDPLSVGRQHLIESYQGVIKKHGISIVHVHQTPSGLLAATAASELGIPVVFTLHGTYYPKDEAIKVAQLCSAVISVSKPVQLFWEKLGVKTTLISNGIDVDEFRPDSAKMVKLPSLPSDATVVTYVSRLAWQKATVCNMVLRATKTLRSEIPNLHIVVVGSGAQSIHVHELAKALNKAAGQPYIHIVGEQTDVRPYYAISDLVIGTGRVALEAMACEKPVLAIGNHGYVGLVAPSSYDLAWDCYFGDHSSVQKPSPQLIDSALRQACRDRSQLKEIGGLGRAWVQSNFHITQKCASLLTIYTQVKSGGGQTSMKKVLYVGWLGFKNLGDELMWDAFHDLSRKYLDPAKYKVIPSLPGVDLNDLSEYDTVVLGGGSLLVPGYVDVAYRAVEQKKRLWIWGSGFDSQDKVQLDSSGTLTTKLMTGNEKMSQMLKKIAEHATFFGVRGPVTLQYLQQAGVSDKAWISGDPGMLLLPASSAAEADKSKRLTIGINWGTSYNRIYGKNENAVEDALVHAAKRLIKLGYDIHLLTMWGPDREAIKRLHKKIGDPTHTILDLELHDHSKMLELMKGFQATINFKLHANVLSAAAGVPFVCLAYRIKSIDFAYSLDLPELLVSTDEPQLGDRILICTWEAIARREQIAAKIAASQKKMMENLEQPFIQGLL